MDAGHRPGRLRRPVTSISGLSFDGSGLIAVRPAVTRAALRIGVAYFSPNGQAWQYAGTIDPAGGWSPGVVKGGNDGFVVTGTVNSQNIYVAYTSTGTGTTWRPTGSLGDTSSEPLPSAAVGPDSTVIAIGSTYASNVSQQAVFLTANTAGKVTPISLVAIPGGFLRGRREQHRSRRWCADRGGQRRRPPGRVAQASNGSWTMVSSLPLVSTYPGPGCAVQRDARTGWMGRRRNAGPVILTSVDGTSWQPAGGNIARTWPSVSAVATAAGPAGYVIVAS